MRHFIICSKKANRTILTNNINVLSGIAQANTSSCPESREADIELTADDIPFSLAKHGNFLQSPPQLQNTYVGDSLLVQYLQRYMPKEILKPIHEDLLQFGALAAGNLYELSLECERSPPKLTSQDAWGRRQNHLFTCAAWKQMHEVSAREGLISIGYEKEYGQWSRLYQVCKLYLFAPSSGLYSCPLAMTDGAAKTIQALKFSDPTFQEAYNHFTSRNPEKFWTSGQWMTEKRGGSDVSSGTETLAYHQQDGSYRLYGYKWFTSALDANATLTLARIVDGKNPKGQPALSMFYLKTKDNSGNWNNIQSVRLKDKLGTRQLPTAELLLDGSIAFRMSNEGRGVASISNMLTMTRIHNGISSVAAMRRILNFARDYSQKRSAFGQLICKYPLHLQTMARMEIETRGSMLLMLEIAKLLGKEENGCANEQDSLLIRILTPIFKLYTAKQAVSVVSEGLECMGGQGYMEDTGFPVIFRDAQVLPIWEGTTNILSLDVLRGISKTRGKVLHAVASDISQKLANHKSELKSAKDAVMKSLKSLGNFVQENPDKLEVAARDLTYSIARTYIGALTIEYASHPEAKHQDIATALRWCSGQNLAPVVTNSDLGLYKSEAITNDYEIVMDGFQK